MSSIEGGLWFESDMMGANFSETNCGYRSGVVISYRLTRGRVMYVEAESCTSRQCLILTSLYTVIIMDDAFGRGSGKGPPKRTS